MMYSDGRGVPQDYKEAIRLYKLAAKQGDSMAQFNVGVMYRNGWGVLADYIVAHMWYDIFAINGHEIGAGNREKLAKKMTSEDISKAQALARVCMSSNYKKCGYLPHPPTISLRFADKEPRAGAALLGQTLGRD